VDAHGVARLEPGAIAAQLALFEVLNDAVHKNGPVGPACMLADGAAAGRTGLDGCTGKARTASSRHRKRCLGGAGLLADDGFHGPPAADDPAGQPKHPERS
jgi:hypothetical protein